MMLLSDWYDLSEIVTEKLVKDSIDGMPFFVFRLEDETPYHTISM
ncbi:MAG: hypothetical protein ACMUEL_02370 [Flavobacteriales bacterium Tduv]